MATAELLVDTDVLIDHLRGIRRFAGDVAPVAVSVVTRCELFAGRDESARLRRLLGSMVEIGVDAEIAELAGLTRRRFNIATPDALIAATALVHGLTLVTRNRRHFDRVADLRVRSPD